MIRVKLDRPNLARIGLRTRATGSGLKPVPLIATTLPMALRSFPPLPGSIIRHRIINAMGIRQADLAAAMGISKVRVNQIINGHAPITPEMALRLATVTATEPDYWLRLQSDFDLHQTRRRLAGLLETLPRLVPS